MLVELIITFIVLYLLFCYCKSRKENYADIAGALMQLEARDPQDAYEMVGTRKYWPWFYGGPYGLRSYPYTWASYPWPAPLVE